MHDKSPRLALLMREAGLLSDPSWDEYVQYYKETARASKGILDILQQSAFSAETYRDLFTLPFSKKEESIPGLTRTLQITVPELIRILEVNHPGVSNLHHLLREMDIALSPPQITTISEAESLGRKGYPMLVRRGVFTPDRLGDIVKASVHSYAMPNRIQLASAILSHNGLCSLEDFLACLKKAQKARQPVGAILGAEGVLNESRLVECLKEGLDLPEARLEDLREGQEELRLFPGSFVRRQMFLPITRAKAILTIAIADPLYMSLCDVLSIVTGLVVHPLYAPHEALIDKINGLYAGDDSPNGEATGYSGAPDLPETYAVPEPLEEPTELEQERADARADRLSAVGLVSTIIERAIAARATDIHIEPLENGVRVRYRIDGSLRLVMNLPREMHDVIIARTKVLAGMNVTERRRPQDGSFRLSVASGVFDFRVSVIPAHNGEKAVIRILDQSLVFKSTSDLGMTEFQEKTLHSWITRSYGAILVTGPTGSGKSSTLYASLNLLNDLERNIITIEDPVEYQLAGVTQVAVDRRTDLTFAEGLRSALRQDPDVIMVGEIRDQETARIAMRAAMTGHLMFSTLHTNGAAGAVSALRNMGIQPYVIANALVGVVTQRLLKQLCVHCRRREEATPGLLRDLGLQPTGPEEHVWFWKAVGCDECLQTGYLGREGVFELLVVDETLRRLIASDVSEAELVKASREMGLMSLMESALQKVAAGVTSPDEMVKTILLA